MHARAGAGVTRAVCGGRIKRLHRPQTHVKPLAAGNQKSVRVRVEWKMNPLAGNPAQILIILVLPQGAVGVETGQTGHHVLQSHVLDEFSGNG